MATDYDWYSSEALEKQGVDGSTRPRLKQTPAYMPSMYDYGLKHAIAMNSEYGGWGTWLKVFGSEDAALTQLTKAVTATYRSLDKATVAEPDLMPHASAVIEHAISSVEFTHRSAMYAELQALERCKLVVGPPDGGDLPEPGDPPGPRAGSKGRLDS